MIPKFRAWLIHDKIMFDLIGFKDLDKDYIELYTTTNGTLKFPKKNIVLLQSTGMTARGNKEIFEGDIVEIYDENPHRRGVVKYNEEERRLEIFGKYDIVRYIYLDQGLVKVIGNIHENPELLEDIY